MKSKGAKNTRKLEPQNTVKQSFYTEKPFANIPQNLLFETLWNNPLDSPSFHEDDVEQLKTDAVNSTKYEKVKAIEQYANIDTPGELSSFDSKQCAMKLIESIDSQANVF